MSEREQKQPLRANLPEVIAAMANGASERDVATAYGVVPSAVHAMKERHASAIVAAQTAVAERIVEHAIVTKVGRINELVAFYEEVKAAMQEQGHVVKVIAFNSKGEPVSERTFIDSPAILARLKVLDQIADELGQKRPKEGDTNITVLVKQVLGIDPDKLV